MTHMRPVVQAVLDEMETSLVLKDGRLVGTDDRWPMQMSLVEVKLDTDRNSVSMFFELQQQYGNHGRPKAMRDGWLVGKQKPLARILKSMAKVWVLSDPLQKLDPPAHSAATGRDWKISFKDIVNVELVVNNARWPKLVQFAREKWESASADLRQAMRERALNKAKIDLREAMRFGLTFDDIQDAWRELIVEKVQLI